jgi:hypothetical protein
MSGGSCRREREIRWKHNENQQLKRKTVSCSSKVFLIENDYVKS